MYSRSTAPHAPCLPLNNIPLNYQPVCYSVPWQFSMAPYTCSLCNSRKPRSVYSQPRPYTRRAPLLIMPRAPRPGMVISALAAWHGSVTIPYKQVLRGSHALCTELAVLTALSSKYHTTRWPVRYSLRWQLSWALLPRVRACLATPHGPTYPYYESPSAFPIIATPLGIVVST